MKKNGGFKVGMRREYFSLDKDNTKEYLAEGLTIQEAHKALGEIAHEYMANGYEPEGCHPYMFTLWKSAGDPEEQETLEFGIIDEDGKGMKAISYAILCRYMTAEDTMKIIDNIKENILLVSGHNKI